MDILLTVIQVALLIATGIILWQIWQYLHSELIPDDQPLGEDRAKYLTHRLDLIKYLLLAEAVITIAGIFLRVFALI